MNSFYYIDGGGTTRTLYIAGTTTTQLVQPGTEFGWESPAVAVFEEPTPNRMADQYRSVAYRGRRYGFDALLVGTSAANLETLRGNWMDWHDRELGEGYVKRITHGGTTLCLDCIPLRTDYRRARGYSQILRQTYQAANPWWRDETLNSSDTAVTVTNASFETYSGSQDDGTSDTFGANWTVASDDGNGDKCEATATVKTGSNALMLTRGTGTVASLTSANIAVTAGNMLRLTYWTRGDGTYAGRYRLLDVTNSEDIVPITATGVTGTTYTQVGVNFTIPAGCENLQIRYIAPATNTGVAYFDVTALTITHVIGCNSVVYNGTFEAGGTGGDFNGGAEADDGTSDDFDNMVEVTDDGNGDKVEATATQHGGTYAVMITRGTGTPANIRSENIVAVPGEVMTWSLWTRGDGTYAGRYGVYDVTNAAWITAATTTGITAATYAEITPTFTVPAGCVAIRLYGFCNTTNTSVVYFDDWTLTRTTIVISINNAGDIPTWPYITLTGIVVTPVLTNSDDDAMTINKTTVAAADTLIADHKPGGSTRRCVKYYSGGTGAGTFCTLTSASKFYTLPTGTNNLTVTATSGTPTVEVGWYNYYGSLF